MLNFQWGKLSSSHRGFPSFGVAAIVLNIIIPRYPVQSSSFNPTLSVSLFRESFHPGFCLSLRRVTLFSVQSYEVNMPPR